MEKLCCLLCAIALLLPAMAAAHTYVDSVFADAELDGNMIFCPDGSPYAINWTSTAMMIGDLQELYDRPANSALRGFFSFFLPEKQTGYKITNVTLRLFQYRSIGNADWTFELYPEWNIAGGDTVDCIISHIDYGSELWFDDWEKGDIGNPNTYNHNVGVITREGMNEPSAMYGEQGYRYLDVTPCIELDYALGNAMSQYRVSFEIDTDGDSLSDFVEFTTANSIQAYWPTLFFTYWDGVSVDDEEIPELYQLQVYPQPVRGTATLSFALAQPGEVTLEIFNIRGQRVATLLHEHREAGTHSVTWQAGGTASGVYLARVSVGNVHTTCKVCIVK